MIGKKNARHIDFDAAQPCKKVVLIELSIPHDVTILITMKSFSDVSTWATHQSKRFPGAERW